MKEVDKEVEKAGQGFKAGATKTYLPDSNASSSVG